jgi:protein-disulfide isomerase
MLTRRCALALTAAFLASPAQAREEQKYPLRADDGGDLSNYPVPVELDPGKLPGIVWKGPASGDVSIYEFFDYNCGFCRAAARDLDAMVAADPKLRLGLVNNAILSMGSAQAAKVQQAVLRLHGPPAAYDYHMRMFARRGEANGASALAVVRAMGLDAAKIEASGDADSVTQVLVRQQKLAEALDLDTTPSFVVSSTAVAGWAGPKALKRIVANSRKCGAPHCGG